MNCKMNKPDKSLKNKNSNQNQYTIAQLVIKFANKTKGMPLWTKNDLKFK